MDDKERLLDLLALHSFRLGRFKLSAGGESDYYIDCRLTTLSAEGAWLCGSVFLAELARLPQPPAAIGGLTLGADPIVVAVAAASSTTPTPMNGFLVRKTEKGHGLGNKIEGRVERGARVAIVDDVCTTAASTIQAIGAAWEAGMEVIAVRCLVEREEAGGRANLDTYWREHRGGACPFAAVFTASDVRAAHLRLAGGEAGR